MKLFVFLALLIRFGLDIACGSSIILLEFNEGLHVQGNRTSGIFRIFVNLVGLEDVN